MRTLGFILGTLVLFLGTSVMAGTEYGPSATGMDSIGIQAHQYGFAFQDQVSIDSSGNLLITYVNQSLGRTRTLWTSNWGAGWTTTDSTLITSSGNIYPGATWQYSFGNQTFIMGGAEATKPPALLRLFSGTTRGILDTITLLSASDGDYLGLSRHGGSDSDIIAYAPVEGTIDTIRVWQSNGNPTGATTWTNRETDSKGKYGLGGRVPFVWTGGVKGGVAILDATEEDLFWADTTGVDTLSTAVIPNNLPASAAAAGMMDIVPVVDSFGFVVWQTSSVSASACSLLVRAFHISNVGGGSGTVVVDSASPSPPITVLVAPGKLRTSMVFCPRGAALWGTDTAFIFAWYYPDTTSTRTGAQIVRWMSTNKGKTWGSMVVDRDSSGFPGGGKTSIGLTIPKRLYNNSGTINFACVYQDSLVSTARDSARVWLSSLSVVGTTATHNRTRRTANTRGNQ